MRALRKRGKALGVVTALAALTVFAAVAFADNVVDTVDGDVNTVVAIANGGTTDAIGVKVNGAGSDGCDLDNGKATELDVKISAAPGPVSVLDASGAPLADETLTFTDCQTFQYFKLSSTAEGDHAITATLEQSGGSETGDFRNQFGFTLRVGAGSGGGGDSTPPVITITQPIDGGTYFLNQQDDDTKADYKCEDDESDVTQCDGPVANGAYFDTSDVGSHDFTVDASSAGGSDSATHTYNVIYEWSGFFRPVDNLPTLNKAKAGSGIPLKWSLNGDQGLDIMETGYPKSQAIACPGGDPPTDNIEETDDSGKSGLKYDPAPADQYSYVWKTIKQWAGTCRQVVVKLDDGTEHQANFHFAK